MIKKTQQVKFERQEPHDLSLDSENKLDIPLPVLPQYARLVVLAAKFLTVFK